MKRHLITVLVLGIFSFGCSTKEKFQEITPRFLQNEIKISSAPDNLSCSWRYRYNEEYHLFYYSCMPNEEPRGSFFTILKRYKIKRSLLFIKNIHEVGGSVGRGLNSLDIEWNYKGQ